MPIRIQFGAGRGNAPAWLSGWPGRVLAAALGVLILAGVVLFFTLFLAVAAVFVAVFVVGAAIRWWWTMGKPRRQAARQEGRDGIDAEHRVIDVDVIEASREID